MGKKESFFRGKVHENAKKVSHSTGGSYLTLSKDDTLLMFDETVKKVQMDFLPYIVTDTNHPDKDEAYGVALKGNPWYRRPYKLHRSIGVDNKSYVCPTSIGKKCPICEQQKILFEQEEREAAIKLYPQDRILYIPVPLDSKKHDQNPFLWDMSSKMFHQCLKERLDENDDNEIFPDLNEGKTLELTFKWDKIGKQGKPFPETVWIEFLDREPWDEDVLNDVPNLDEIIRNSVLTYAELKAIFFATDVETEGGELTDVEDEQEKEKHPARRPIGRKPVEEEEKPVKRGLSRTPSRAPSKPKQEEPEEEEEDNIDIPVKERCVACEGTGKNSRGKPCPICGGTGRKPKAKSTPKQEENDCPSGFDYGKDHGTQPECDDCDVYNECLEAKSKLRRKS
jgi:hypothetical protein